MISTTFNFLNLETICDQLALRDADLARVIVKHGYPPVWSRPNTFESLVHIILEQQVSITSALAALNKLKAHVQEITPLRILLLTDEELRECYFSRQKTAYIKYLAEALVSGQIDLPGFEYKENDEIRKELTALKGIGNWTVDVYLMFVLQRSDIFPVGDLAAVNALKQVKGLKKGVSKESILEVAEFWKPYRTVATMMLWHYYLSVKARKQA